MCYINNTQKCFPLNTYGELCKLLGLNWAMAEELFKHKFLIHQPVVDEFPSNEAQEELIFIGSMIAAGCTLEVLSFATKSLKRPYSYKHRDVFFDWTCGQWVDKSKQGDPWEIAIAHINDLSESKDIDSLITLKKYAEEAIESLSLKPQ